MSSTYIDAMYFEIFHFLSFSFPFVTLLKNFIKLQKCRDRELNEVWKTICEQSKKFSQSNRDNGPDELEILEMHISD
jgi:hypothetical protein